jgi:hypothetical protein
MSDPPVLSSEIHRVRQALAQVGIASMVIRPDQLELMCRCVELREGSQTARDVSAILVEESRTIRALNRLPKWPGSRGGGTRASLP